MRYKSTNAYLPFNDLEKKKSPARNPSLKLQRHYYYCNGQLALIACHYSFLGHPRFPCIHRKRLHNVWFQATRRCLPWISPGTRCFWSRSGSLLRTKRVWTSSVSTGPDSKIGHKGHREAEQEDGTWPFSVIRGSPPQLRCDLRSSLTASLRRSVNSSRQQANLTDDRTSPMRKSRNPPSSRNGKPRRSPSRLSSMTATRSISPHMMRRESLAPKPSRSEVNSCQGILRS